MRARIDDAIFLWKHGHQEGAFLMALVAISASARRRFPDHKTVRDSDAFVQFLTSVRPSRISVEYRGEMHTVEYIFINGFAAHSFMKEAYPKTSSLCKTPSPARSLFAQVVPHLKIVPILTIGNVTFSSLRYWYHSSIFTFTLLSPCIAPRFPR
jgi:hypothetical protein